MTKIIPNVDDWKRKNPSSGYVYQEGKNVRINTKKAIPRSAKKILNRYSEEQLNALELLIIERKLFFHKTDMLCQYIDYFIEFFDSDKELPVAYLFIKTQLDNRRNMTVNEFINMVIMRLFKDTFINVKVYEMVDYNYNLDVTRDSKTGRKFEGFYDFTNDDARCLLAISTVMKFIIPIISQYIVTNTVNDDEAMGTLITDIFMEVFFRVGSYRGGDPDNLLIKLYKFTEDKILKHSVDHQALWSQQSALRGLTENKHVDTILIKHLISNNMFKFRFNDSIISFMKSIVETQLACTINKVKYKADPIRVDNTPDVNGLSGVDKLEQSLAKMDETAIIRYDKSRIDVINHLESIVGHISDEEIAYYGTNFVTSSVFHNTLLGYFYAKYFNGFIEFKNKDIFQHIRMLVIAKRMLKNEGYTQLPQLLSSVTRGKTSMRLKSAKFTNKVAASSTYKNLTDSKYRSLKNYKEDIIISIISQTLNNIYTHVDYDEQELTGEIIEFDEDIVSNEILNFVDNI